MLLMGSKELTPLKTKASPLMKGEALVKLVLSLLSEKQARNLNVSFRWGGQYLGAASVAATG